MSARIVFFGNERLATGVSTDVTVLKALLSAGYDVCTVVSQYEVGKSRNPRDLEIAAVAAEHNIPLLLPARLRDVSNQLASYQAEAGVLVAYGKIVAQSVIDLFPCGIINIHPSLLPLHRGPTPLESVILAGATETGVSLMQLAAAMDAGPVYDQQIIALDGSETKQQLADQLLTLGSQMLINHLPAILAGTLEAQAQAGEPSYDSKITKDDALVDWRQPAATIERQIRAYAGWPKSRTDIGGRDVTITQAHVLRHNDETAVPGVIWLEGRQLGMHATDGIVVIDQLIPAGKKPMSGADFLLGYNPAN